MTNLRTHYILGFFLSATLGLLIMSLDPAEAILKKLSWNSLPSEVRLSCELGFIEGKKVESGSLDAPMNRHDFCSAIRQCLFLLGAPGGASIEEVKSSGIFDCYPRRRSVSRKQALEAISRMAIHLKDHDLIDFPTEKAKDFLDYKPAEKYAEAFNFLRSKGVVNGYPNGKFYPVRALTNRDSLYLLYRFYEQVSKKLAIRNGISGISFVDIPLDHIVQKIIEQLQRAGAFDLVNLGPSFDGEKPIDLSELAAMISGVLAKQGKIDEIAKIHEILNNKATNKPATRMDLALLLEQMVNSLEIYPQDKTQVVSGYSNVKQGSSEEATLKRLAQVGIRLGYANGILKEKELVSRFEGIGVLGAVIGQTSQEQKNEPDDFSHYPQKSYVKDYAQILKAKKESIFKILNRSRPYRRYEK